MPDFSNRKARISALPVYCNADQAFAVAYVTCAENAAESLAHVSDWYLDALDSAPMSAAWQHRIRTERTRREGRPAAPEGIWKVLVSRLLPHRS